jgi:hypothetical protein
VQVGEYVDQIEPGGTAELRAEECSLVGAVEHHPVDETHHVERSTVHLVVGAQPERRRDRHRGQADRRDDLVLARHVVRRREDGTGRGPPEHVPGAVGTGDGVGQIGAAARDGIECEGGGGTVDVVDEPRRHAGDVDAVNRFLHDGRP